jgi:23S rRNA (pseudouridine1915-N3)-methyltransferase
LEVLLLAVGRLKAGPERELCERYLTRASKVGARLGLKGFAVEEISESRAARPEDRIAAEAELLMARLARDDRVVCLDAGGEPPDSATFAARLAKDAAASVARTVFVIGGPDGLGRAVLDRSNRQMSFGRMTWPHQLARILLAEQLYRATTILSGHPYHRA